MHNKQLVYVGFAFSHHGKHSGYNQIRDYVNYDRFIDCQKSFNWIVWLRRNRNVLTRLYFKIFGSRLWMVELKLIWLSLFNPAKYIFHIIYGENIFKYLGYFKQQNMIVLTLHQPPSFFESRKDSQLRALRHADKLIVMSKEMEDYFKVQFPSKPVMFIPHGVDTKYFKPCGVKYNQILMIGNWLRDFVFAARLFTLLKTRRPDIEVIVLTSMQNHHYFQNVPVKLLSSVTDEELLKLYQTSKILFLPLTSFTANNALLEACSAGCQVLISTDKLNHLSDSQAPVRFIERELEDAYNEILHILAEYSSSIESYNREYVRNNFDWRIIGNQTSLFIWC